MTTFGRHRRIRFPAAAAGLWELEIEVGGARLSGSSVAAIATAFAVDRFKTAVDMGRCSALLAAQDTVLLTHCHSDHVAGLVAWLSWSSYLKNGLFSSTM